ncbi:MAG: NDP-sugar synthase [Candidatus Eremiobacteraeota bacterium]|nr:NDP-sugar synthase [Candidatus Eremiobacteraeota bacterium]
MKAMILAGGLSTRLFPLTRQVPKPLVPVAGEANAIHLIRYLRAHGIREIALNVHYLADHIVQRLGDGSTFDVKLEYLHEQELLGSAGALKQMQWYFQDENFIVVGCDDLTDLPLGALVEFHVAKSAVASIGLVERKEVAQYGVVVLDTESRVSGFQEKPVPGTERSKLVNTGIYAFSPAIFEWIPPNVFYDFGKDVFPSLQQHAAAFFGYEARGAYWCDIGTPEEYRRATLDVLMGRFHIPQTRANGADPSASVDPGARVEGAVWIGRDAVVSAGVRVVGPSVIGDSVHLAPEATVERSILWEGTTVGKGARVIDSIAGINYRVDPGCTLRDAIVANSEVGEEATS